MKKDRKTFKFDYSNYSTNPFSADYEELKDYQFWGFHPKKGRLHIDTKRFIKMYSNFENDEKLFLELNKNRNTQFFIPKFKNRHDYKVNILRDLLLNLKNDWEKEFKPIFNYIKSPKDVEDDSRISQLMMTSCSDDYADIEVEAKLDAIYRINKYEQVIRSLYCQFIMKIVSEVERYILIFMKLNGYNGNEFNYDIFSGYSDALALAKGKRNTKITKIDGYNSFNEARAINNFLKHNSIFSYNKLKNRFPDAVACKENGTSKTPYESGMFAGDWVIIKDDYIDNLLKDLNKFFENYCSVYFDEDIEESKWNYDEYFYDIYDEVKYPNNYFGL